MYMIRYVHIYTWVDSNSLIPLLQPPRSLDYRIAPRIPAGSSVHTWTSLHTSSCESMASQENMSVLSQDKLHFSIITWDIRNFLNGLFFTDIPLESPEFITHFKDPIRWKLQVAALGLEGKDRRTALSVKRSSDCTGPKRVTIMLKLMIVDGMGRISWEKQEECSFIHDHMLIFKDGPLFDDLMDSNGVVLLSSGVMKIRCEMLDASYNFVDPCTDEDLMILSREMSVLNTRSFKTDLELNCHGERFQTHVAILNARCPLIGDCLRENPFHVYRCLNLSQYCNSSLLKDLITFWYTGDFQPLLRNASFDTYDFLKRFGHKELLNYFQPETIEISTTFDVYSTTVEWMIKDYFKVRIYDIVESEEFQQELPSGVTTWRFALYPNGTPRNPDHISFFVTKMKGCTKLPIHLEMTISHDGEEYYPKSTLSWHKKDGKFGFYQYIKQRDALNKPDPLLLNNTLSLKCKLKFSTGKVYDDVDSIANSTITALTAGNCYRNFANDLEKLYTSGEYHNVVLKIQEKHLLLYIPILAARSKFFETMFKDYYSKEGQESIVRIAGTDSETFDKIMRYIYCAKSIALNVDTALELYPYVHRYSISRLSRLCSDLLRNNLTFDNVLDITEAAYMCTDLAVLIAARKFVSDNWIRIKNTEHWKKFQNENKELVDKFMHFMNDPLRKSKPDSHCTTF